MNVATILDGVRSEYPDATVTWEPTTHGMYLYLDFPERQHILCVEFEAGLTEAELVDNIIKAVDNA